MLSEGDVIRSGEEFITDGSCGEDAVWTISKSDDDEYILTISGTGEVTSNPWEDEYKNLINIIRVEDGITQILKFVEYKELNKAVVADSVEELPNNVFYWCQKLEDVKLPEGITNIPWCGFYYCENLKKIEIPASVVSIEHGAFDKTSLSTITIPNTCIEFVDSMYQEYGRYRDKYPAYRDRVYYCGPFHTVNWPDTVTFNIIKGDKESDGISYVDSSGEEYIFFYHDNNYYNPYSQVSSKYEETRFKNESRKFCTLPWVDASLEGKKVNILKVV